MSGFTKILVPTDFSTPATAALHAAADLAGKFGAKLLIAHVTEEAFPYESYGLGADTIQRIRADQRAAIDKALAKARAACGDGADIELIVTEGLPSHRIIELAKEHGADLIVIATQGRNGITDFLLGSTTERVLRIAPCLVLVVRDDQDG